MQSVVYANTMTTDCIFCKIINNQAPATIVDEWVDALAIIPLNPCVPGHILVIPKHHAKDAVEMPAITALTMYRTVELANLLDIGSCNIITNIGAEASQTVFHLHIHIVPRKENDGIQLPWPQHR